MRYLLPFLLAFITITSACAEPPPPFETPAGWKVTTDEARGLRLFVPVQLPREGVAILLLPVMPLDGDAVVAFNLLVDKALAGKKIVEQTPVTTTARGPYRDVSRILIVEDAQGHRSWMVCALSTHDRQAQLALYVAGSEDAFKNFSSAAVAFQKTWNFARLDLSPGPAAQTGTLDWQLLAKIVVASTNMLLLQEQTQYEKALEGWRTLEKAIESMPRFPSAKPGSNEAFWEEQLASYQRRAAQNILSCTLSLGRFEEAVQLAMAEIAVARQRHDEIQAAAGLASLSSARFSLLDFDGARQALLEAHRIIDGRFAQLADAVEKILVKPAASVTAADTHFVNEAFTVFSEARTQYSKIFALCIQLGLFEDAIAIWDSPAYVRLDKILEDPAFRRTLAASMAGIGPELTAEVMKRYDNLLPLSREERITSLLTAWRLKAQESGSNADWSTVRDLLEQVRVLAAKSPDDVFEQAALHGHEGSVAAGMGQWPLAAREFEKALELSKAIKLQEYRNALRQIVLIKYAEACAELDRPKQGLAALEEAEKLPAHPDRGVLSSFYFALGKVLAAAQQTDKAAQAYSYCIGLLEVERNGVKDPELLKKFSRRRQHLYEEIIHFFTRYKQLGAAFEVMERGRSRALYDIFSKTLVSKGRPANLTAQVTAIRERERQREVEENRKQAVSLESAAVARGVANGSARPGPDKSIDQVLASQPELAEMTFGQVPSTVTPDFSDIGDSTAVVEYYIGERYSAVIASNQKNRGIYELKITRAELASLVGDLRSAIQSGSDDEWRSPADRLYQALIAPVQSHLAGRSRLLIVPHGPTNYLPWSLLAPSGGHPLVDDHEIVVLPSLFTLQLCRAKARPAPASGVAFAIGNLPSGDLPALPGTREEVTSIAQVMPAMKIVLEKDFTFANLASKARDAAVLHFATHGFVNGQNPDRSGIVTAEGNLYLPDIVNLDLHAGLVVLSACSTGLGKIYGGDEMIGLTRSFMYAGTPSIVATLWMVADKPTARFMVLFYEALKNGKDKAAALRLAQLDLRKEFPQPIFWAPFTLYGDWK